jgi:SHS2 domain-containing protein
MHCLEDGGRFASQKAVIYTVITARTSHLASAEQTSGWVAVVVML